MTEEEKKRTPAERATGSYGEAAEGIVTRAGQQAEAERAAGEQQIADVNAAEQQRAGAASSAMERYRQQVDRGITDFATLVEGEKERIRRAEQEARQQVQGDNRAAKVTGVTEALASIVNLVGVAGHGASNQVYHSYSQDWMRKADADMREHRNRIDNMRDRQLALQERLIQMKAGDAEQAMNFAMREAEAARNNAVTLAGLRYNTAVNPGRIMSDAQDKAAQLRLQGEMQGMQFEQQERNAAWQDARAKQQIDAQMLMRGFVPDESAPGGYRYDAETAASIGAAGAGYRSGSGSGNPGSGLNYDTIVNGRRMTLNMNDGTFKNAVEFGKSDIRKDLQRIAGAGSWKELEDGAKGRNGKYGEYAGVIAALNGTGDNADDDSVIIRFLQDHRDEMDSFNEHLFRSSSRQTDWGPTAMYQQATEQQGQAPKPGSGVMLDVPADDFMSWFMSPAPAPAESPRVEEQRAEAPDTPEESVQPTEEVQATPAGGTDSDGWNPENYELTPAQYRQRAKQLATASLNSAFRSVDKEMKEKYGMIMSDGIKSDRKIVIKKMVDEVVENGKTFAEVFNEFRDNYQLPMNLIYYLDNAEKGLQSLRSHYPNA